MAGYKKVVTIQAVSANTVADDFVLNQTSLMSPWHPGTSINLDLT